MREFPAAVIVHLIFLLLGNINAEVLIRPGDANINYYGRFDFSDSASVKFNWPGSIIEACFSGSFIGVELDDGGGNHFNVELDGKLVDSLSPTAATRRTIRTNLSTTVDHTIRIILRSNSLLTCRFGGFYIADGKTLVERPERPIRRMEFIGDSWTAADVVGAPLGKTDYNLKDFNATLSYARLASSAYHAQDILIAKGGCGLVKSNDNEPTMLTRYPEILCDGSTRWDFSSWIPDVVVIFLGINDKNNNVGENDFKTAYTTLISTVRGYYGDVPVILADIDHTPTSIPDLAGSFNNVFTFRIPFGLWDAMAEYWHPTAEQHRQIADALIPVVKQATGWDTIPPVANDVSRRMPFVSCDGNPRIIKTAQDKIELQPNPFRREVEVAVFNGAGRQVGRLVTRKRTVSLEEDFYLPKGLYFVKTEK